MEVVAQLIDFILHIDVHLDTIIRTYGAWSYAVLFLIVFCETGLVVTPFLPGDSLLFAAGAIAARGNLDPVTLAVLLIIAAILGDGVNYSIGNWFGARLIARSKRSRLLGRIIKQEYIDKTERYYQKYGGKTIVFARFIPIVRTFAPFLAGVGTMNYSRFAYYNVTGALIWVILFVGAGYAFGDMPIVRKNFTLVILMIIVLSVLPAVIEYVRSRRARPEAALI